MATPHFKDFYKALGVRRNATEDEIKKEYRRLVRELHPDVNTDEETREKFKGVTEAYDTLSDIRKKEPYDASYDAWREGKISGKEGSGQAGRTRPQPPRREGSRLGDLFSNVVRETGLTSSFATELRIPENDLGLLVALREAYKSSQEGSWKVMKSSYDAREWMPNVIYRVNKDAAGKVTILRTIKDWRKAEEREDPIKLINDGESETRVPYNRFSLDVLSGRKDKKILDELNIPKGYEGYLDALQSFMSRSVSGDAKTFPGDFKNELFAINGFTDSYLKDTPKERQEKCWRVSFADFPAQLRRVEGTVRKAEVLGKEGGKSSRAEGTPPTFSPGEGKV